MVALPVRPGVSWETSNPPSRQELEDFAREQARRYGVEPESYVRQINQESGFRTHGDDGRPLTSSAGAIGIAQFMPATAQEEGIDPTDWRASLEAGARYRAKQQQALGGNERAGVAAYNHGAGNVGGLIQQYGADWEAHLPAETQQYLAAVYGDAGPSQDSGSPGIGIMRTGDAGGASSGHVLRGMEPVSQQPGYLYDMRGVDTLPNATPGGFEPTSIPNARGLTFDASLTPVSDRATGLVADNPYLNTGDVPYAAGQDDPRVQAANEHARAVQAVRDWGNAPSLFSKAKGLATADVGPLETAKGLVRDAFNEGVPGTGVIGRTVANPTNFFPAIGFLSQGANAVRELGGLVPGVPDLPGGGDLAATQFPTTALDTALTIGPGNIAKGAREGAGLLRGVRGLEEAGSAARGIPGALGIIGKGKDEMRGFEESLRIGKRAYADAIGAGKTIEEAKAAQRAALTSGAEVTADKAAYETARGMEQVGNAERFKPNQRGGSLAGRARGLEEAMTPPGAAGITDGTLPKWAPASLTAARELGQEGETGRFSVEAIKGMADDALGQTLTQTREQIPFIDLHVEGFKRAGNTESLDATLKVRQQFANDLVNLEAEEASRGIGTLSAAADRLTTGAKPAGPDALATALGAAKKLGDPASVVREMVFGKGSEPAAGSSVRGNEYTDAAKAEREAAKQEERATAQAERKAVETHQATVEAMDLERRKAAWVAKTEAEKALAEAKGYHEGGIGKEIVGLAGLPRALSLSTDVGTARDLGLFVGTKEGRQAFARGGAAGLKSVIHSDEDARLVISEAEKGSRWFEFASDAKNLPGERPYHRYEFGSGATAETRVPEMSGLNESRISSTVERLHPGIRLSDRALAVQRNVAGVDLLDSRLNELALKYGVSGPEDAVKNPRFLSEAQSTIDSVNHLRGYSGGDKAKASSALNVFTSPQQLFSRLQVIGDPINMALRGDTESAKFAAKSLMGFATSQGALLGLARVTGGPGRWSVNLDPTSSDFGTVKVGNTRYDAMAGLGPTLRLVGKIGAELSDQAFGTDYAKNQAAIGVLLTRWLSNKEQPVSRVVTDFMQYNKLPDEQTAINMIVPSLASGFMQTLAEERGTPAERVAKATAGAAANAVGIGVNTYKSDDDVKRETAQDLGVDDYNALDPVQKLKVLANLPSDAGKTVMRDEKQAYEAAKKQAGYQDAPTDADGKPIKELPEVARNRANANAEVYKKNATLDVQRWFYGSKDGGNVNSREAATQALDLGLKDRKVTFAGNDRNLAATEDDRKAWKEYAETLDTVENVIAKDPKNLDAFAQYKYKKPYAQLKDTEQGAVRTAIVDGAKTNPRVEAVMIFFGQEKPNANGEYHASSAEVVTELQKLWKQFPDAAPLPKAEHNGHKTTLLINKR